MIDHVADIARRYLAGGLSIVPIKCDGSKAPCCASWAPYQQRQATEQEILDWYGRGPAGVAILGGPVSGGVEILDFDMRAAWDAWRDMALSLLRDAGEVLPRLPLVQTPSDGRHLYYRHVGEQAGNTKLATRRVDGRPETVIETRGRGGYVLAPGCPSACHLTGNTYDLLQGDLASIPTISFWARDILLDAARALSEHPVESERVLEARSTTAEGTRPGDIYNQRGLWDELLRRHGWRPVRRSGRTTYWRRPGKTQGISASTGHDLNYLYVWSSNAPPFEPERAYSLFSAYALLEHHGDFAAASAALVVAGYVSDTQRHLSVHYSTGREATNRLIGTRAS